MCIAIYKPADKTIDKDTLKNCFDNNKDGCGFACINEDMYGVKRIIIRKTMNFDTFWNQYQRALKINPESPFLIHFRIATHGGVNKYNCHPFSIDKDTVFIHNGIISKVSKHEKKSDTQMFNEEILKSIHPVDLVYNDAIRRVVESFIANSKLVVMNTEGDVQIYNEKDGNWKDGVWYSNKTYEKRTTSYTSYYANNNTRTHGYHYGWGSGYTEHYPIAKSKWSQEHCDECGEKGIIHNMFPYRFCDDVVIFCGKCDTKGREKRGIKVVDKLAPEHYVDYINETSKSVN